MVQLLLLQLEQIGMIGIGAGSGEEALEALATTHPDLVLLDIMMPGISGHETCRRIKDNAATADIPVIFMTALSETRHKLAAFRTGAVDYVSKHFQKEELLARVRTHVSLSAVNHQLEEQVAELQAFAHTVAHDLKNPLSVITSALALLMDGKGSLEKEQLRMVELARSSGMKAINIVDELLLLAEVRAEEVVREPVPMGTVVFQARERLTGLELQTGAMVREQARWPAALGYAPWIEEVWVNYLSNALKYGGDPPEITLGAQHAENGWVTYYVRDLGPGIPPEQRVHLYTEFSQLSQRRVSGHGLGLSIVRRIVHKLGGHVGYRPGPEGAGSEFFFQLEAA